MFALRLLLAHTQKTKKKTKKRGGFVWVSFSFMYFFGCPPPGTSRTSERFYMGTWMADRTDIKFDGKGKRQETQAR